VNVLNINSTHPFPGRLKLNFFPNILTADERRKISFKEKIQKEPLWGTLKASDKSVV